MSETNVLLRIITNDRCVDILAFLYDSSLEQLSFLCHSNFAFRRSDLFIICLFAVHLAAVRVVRCLMKMRELVTYSEN
jgi:hypothetical protein